MTLLIAGILFLLVFECAAQIDLNGKNISAISIDFPSGGKSTADEEEFRSIASNFAGPTYSTVRIRDSIEALHRTGRVVSVDVEAQDTPTGVDLHYLIKRKVQAQKVAIEIQNVLGEPVTEQELMFKLNLLDPGTPITDQTLQNNANVMLEYLRDRGFYNAEVTFTQTSLQN